MATHRSLNKLEFKAHMSIHNMTDMCEAENQQSNFTRDRFGKKHSIVDSEGVSSVKPLRSKISISLLAVFCLLPAAFAFAETAAAQPKKGPNYSVTSDDPEVRSSKEWMNRDNHKFGIPVGGSSALGINEYGDPNIGTRF